MFHCHRMYSRREALGSAAAAFRLQTISPGALSRDPLRPRFHFLPPSAWMNDPNAPVYFRGKYHLYYQHNPKAAKWDTMHWGHAVSEDLLHWQHRPIALRPTPGGPDHEGCWSGCMVIDQDQPAILYTGVHPQVQVLARSTDLEKWEKRLRPVIAAPPPGLDTPGFRDPHVWREDGEWLMLLGAGVRGVGGCLLLYSSRNLVDWKYEKVMLSGRMDRSAPGGDVARGEMWECPDFFPVGNKHLVYVATRNRVLYWLGTWNNKTFTPERSGTLLDGAHYAPKSFVDAEGRRLIWSWIREQRSAEEQLKAGWSGVMSLAMEPGLDRTGNLIMAPAPAYRRLREGSSVSNMLPQDCFELVAEVDAGRPFAVRRGGRALIEAAQGRLRSGTAEVALPPGRTRIHAFVDGSVVEIFINQNIVLAGRVYSNLGSVHADGGRVLDAWRLTPVSKDRLTGV